MWHKPWVCRVVMHLSKTLGLWCLNAIKTPLGAWALAFTAEENLMYLRAQNIFSVFCNCHLPEVIQVITSLLFWRINQLHKDFQRSFKFECLLTLILDINALHFCFSHPWILTVLSVFTWELVSSTCAKYISEQSCQITCWESLVKNLS